MVPQMLSSGRAAHEMTTARDMYIQNIDVDII